MLVKMASDQWEELESDPGLFTLLVGDFGVQGVRVQEIYDIAGLSTMKDVYGFVFLFKVVGDNSTARRKRRATEEDNFVFAPDIVNRMFFALQVIPNSCATHALLSILLNSPPRACLGPVLEDLKACTQGLDPEAKGQAIANYPHLARTHEKHAKPHSLKPISRGGVVVTATGHDAFHYSSFVPIDGHLYELDGLKPAPVDHGCWGEGEEWTGLFVRVVQARLSGSKDILFNLMAVVRDRLQGLVLAVEGDQLAQQRALAALARQPATDEELLRAVAEVVAVEPKEDPSTANRPHPPPTAPALLQAVRGAVEARRRLLAAQKELRDEQEVRRGYLLDHARRTHNYSPAIQEFLRALAKHGKLPPSILRRRSSNAAS